MILSISFSKCLLYLISSNGNIIQFQMNFQPFYVIYTYNNDIYCQPLAYYPDLFISENIQREFTTTENLQQKTINSKTQTENQCSYKGAQEYSRGMNQQYVQDSYRQQKRNYRKRRNWLRKTYTCCEKTCSKSYSSEMALRNHERLKHSIRRRESKKNESQ